ncbi:MAG: lysis system i-spanin subunit Rz [Azonexus sp.]
MNPEWIKAVVSGLVASLLVGIVFTTIKSYGNHRYEQGQTAERAAWLQRENTELVAANARIVELEDEARQKEQRAAKDIAAASQTYQENLSHEKALHERTVADLRAGHRRLRIELASRPPAIGDPASPTATAAAGCDAATFGELSTAAAEFLVGLANEADTVVHQLTACQAVVIADRQINQPQGEP